MVEGIYRQLAEFDETFSFIDESATGTHQVKTCWQGTDVVGKGLIQTIDEIFCMTVNDAFVCNAWANANNLEHVQVVPDGSGKFTEEMQMLVSKDNLGFGRRSWRYAAVVENGVITDWFIEEGKEDDHDQDPYMFTAPQYILNKLREGN